MHVALFTDQHPHSLGGVQTSVLLQRKYLNRNGVKVTIFAPKSRRAQPDKDIRVLPSSYVSIGREYSVVWSLRRAAKFCEEIYKSEKFDIVHVQGDFSAASLGTALARDNNLPIVYTSHTNVDVMANKLLGKPIKVLLLRFFAWQYAHFLKLGSWPLVKDAWEYMAFIHKGMDLVIAPSKHFADLLKAKKVTDACEVMITGVDDDLIEDLSRTTPSPQKPVQFVWAGRMQPEKRLLQAIEAFGRSKANARLTVYGFGPLDKAAKNLVRARRLSKKVHFEGKLKHKQMLQVFADADCVMQTSIDFETQGLTVYESNAVGTPTLLCDPKIAAEFSGDSNWLDASGTIKGLAKTIRQASKDIESGKTKRQDKSDTRWLRQSEITKSMIKLYEALITEKTKSTNTNRLDLV